MDKQKFFDTLFYLRVNNKVIVNGRIRDKAKYLKGLKIKGILKKDVYV